MEETEAEQRAAALDELYNDFARQGVRLHLSRPSPAAPVELNVSEMELGSGAITREVVRVVKLNERALLCHMIDVLHMNPAGDPVPR